MPRRNSQPYSTRRRARAGAERRDRLREAAANWSAGDYDTGWPGRSGESEAMLRATAEQHGLNGLLAARGLSDAEWAERQGRHVNGGSGGPAPLPGRTPGGRDGRMPTVSFHPSRETMDAIMKAAAIIACADGQVSPVERLSLLSFLGRQGILAREGRIASAAAFDQAVRETATLRLEDACAAADSLRSIAGRPGAPMVARAAAVVALADGVGWPQELALLEVIRDRLGLRGGRAAAPGEAGA